MSETTAIEVGPLNSTGKPQPRSPAARRKRPWPRRSRRGIGLPGMVVTLVIAAAILLGVFQMYRGTNNNFRTQTAQTIVGTMVAEFRRIHDNLPSYEGSLE